MSNTLYRIYNSVGALLYVGATTNPAARIQAHGLNKTWWPESATIGLQHFDTWQELAAAEVKAIQCENPKYNMVHSKPAVWARKPRGPKGEGSVYLRSADNMWIGKLELPPLDGKRRYTTVSSKDRNTAVAKLAELKASLAAIG